MSPRTLWVLAAAGALLALLPSCTPPLDLTPSADASTTTVPAPRSLGAPTGVGAQVGDLKVAPPAPMTGYSRQAFGPTWADVDDNGCDTRDDVLARDLTDVVFAPDGCEVRSGVLIDPYTGARIAFQRGVSTSYKVQIDHVVALGDAWRTGAADWSPQRREALANDPDNLLAVDGPTNGAKSDSDAADWLPPAAGYRCTYVQRQVAVKTRYKLWLTPAEHDAVLEVLETCPA